MGLHRSTYKFIAIDGEHEAAIDNHNIVRLKMNDVSKVEQHSGYTLVNTGSPISIKFASDVSNIDVVQTGARYVTASICRTWHHVNFVESIAEDGIFVRHTNECRR